jgi:pyruvate/2-oxoglutarate dehydrogenase complex dihydrolipoamide dehydrogenase (E3) component
MELAAVAVHLLVLGGGRVGLEFGQMFRRFGSRVTIIEPAGQSLRHEDSDDATEVAVILKQDGAEVMLNTKPARVTKTGTRIHLTINTGNESRVLDGSH